MDAHQTKLTMMYIWLVLAQLDGELKTHGVSDGENMDI